MSKKKFNRTEGNLAVVENMVNQGGGLYDEDPVIAAMVDEYLATKDMSIMEKVLYYCGKGKDYRVFIEEINPYDADQLLKHNTNNRRVGSGKNDLISYMKDGRFGMVSDMITFDSDGVLTNGQHRLYAIKESKTTQTIVIGCNFAFNPNQDRGSRRQIYQNIELCHEHLGFNNKYFYDRRLVSMVSWLLNLYKIKRNDTFNVIDYMKANKDELEKFSNIMLNSRYPKNGDNVAGINSASFLSATFLAFKSGVSLSLLSRIRDAFATGGKILDEKDCKRFNDFADLKYTVAKYGLADPKNRDALFIDCLTYIYAVEMFERIKGRGGKGKLKMQREALKRYNVEYNGNLIVFPKENKYKTRKR